MRLKDRHPRVRSCHHRGPGRDRRSALYHAKIQHRVSLLGTHNQVPVLFLDSLTHWYLMALPCSRGHNHRRALLEAYYSLQNLTLHGLPLIHLDSLFS